MKYNYFAAVMFENLNQQKKLASIHDV